MTRHISAREARNKFADLMGNVHYGGEEVIVERSGRPMAAVIPVDTYERLVAERRTRFEVLDQIRLRVPDVSPFLYCREGIHVGIVALDLSDQCHASHQS